MSKSGRHDGPLHDRRMRPINPAFHLSAKQGERASHHAFFAHTQRAHHALQMAEYMARELGLEDMLRDLEVARGLVEGAHRAARMRLARERMGVR